MVRIYKTVQIGSAANAYGLAEDGAVLMPYDRASNTTTAFLIYDESETWLEPDLEQWLEDSENVDDPGALLSWALVATVANIDDAYEIVRRVKRISVRRSRVARRGKA